MRIYDNNKDLGETPDIGLKKSSLFSGFLTYHAIPFYSLFKKTISIDLYSRLKLVLSILMLNIVSIIAILGTNPNFLSSASLINNRLGYIQVFFTYCIISIGILIYNYAPTISEEISQGTMIILVTKPISRNQVVIGKFIAIFLYNFTLNLISLGIVCITNYIIFPFQDIFLFFISQFLISFVILFFFSTFEMGISMILKDIKIVMLFSLMLILIMFFIQFFIKPILLANYILDQTYYEAFQLYHFDIGYHIMNVYVGILEVMKYSLNENFLRSFVSWGTHKIIPDEFIPEIDHVVRTNYYTPFASLMLLISFGLVIFIIGLVIFKRREINS